MQKNIHPIEPEEVMAYLDGELPPDRAAAAGAHLERCPECQRLAGDLQGVSRRLMAWQVPPSGAGIPPRIATALGERRRAARPVLRRVPLWGWGLAGACAVVLVIAISEVPLQKSVATARRVTAEARRLPAPSVAGSPMIARTAALTLVTAEFDRVRAGLEDILSRNRGYFGELNVSTPAGTGRWLSATLRVPADRLEAALAELRKLGRVESESQGGEEVTPQYVDLEARLSNARNTAQRLTDLLRERTGKLADVLSVETELDRVRGEIESMEAQRKGLTDRVAFATVNVTVREDYKAQLHALPDSTWNRFRNAAIEGYRTMADGVVGVLVFLVSYGPSLLLWGGLLFFPLRFAWRRIATRSSPVKPKIEVTRTGAGWVI